MEICVLGPLAVRKAQGAVLEEIQPPVRSAILLGSVCLSRRPIGRDEVMQRMWPSDFDKRTEENLNGYVTKARRASGADVTQLHADRGARNLRLVRPNEGPGDGVLVDADSLFAAEGSSERRLLVQALDAVRGQVLDGYDETRFPWLEDARTSCSVVYTKLVRRVTGWSSARAEDFVKRFVARPSGTLWEAVAQELEDSATPDEDEDRGSAAFRSYFRDATDISIESLQRLLLSDRAPLYDATVELRLTDAAMQGKYTLRMTLNYRTRQDRFACALVARAVHTDLILAECPELSDSFALSEDSHLDSYIESLGTASGAPGFGLYQIDKSPSGNTKRRELTLGVASEGEKARILGDLYAEIGSRIVIVAATIPGPAGSMRRLNYWVESELSVDEHYCFWVADRPTYVERITIDCSDFTAPSTRDVRLHPMIGNAASEPHLEDRVYTIDVENWLIRDQGVFVTW